MNMININEKNREKWLKKVLLSIPKGSRILDAGAGELRNRTFCEHLNYVSQDFCQYDGKGDGKALQTGTWDTVGIDIICDITAIPEPESSFDAILCSEVLEHVPEPVKVLKEFGRLLKQGGMLILTAPFASLVHFAPYYYYSGFSSYWYEYHLPCYGFIIKELTANGDWFLYCQQELVYSGAMARRKYDISWPLGYLLGALGLLYFNIRKGRNKADDLACFGWHCVAVKKK
jgi:ubiquinone/menaquinone biosynthesis C-methylase UbiE